MIGDTRTNDSLDVRRRRAYFRAWRRGTREMDLILGRFADRHLAALSETDMDCLEALMDAPDPDLYAWITGQGPVAPAYDTAVFRALVAFHLAGAGAAPR